MTTAIDLAALPPSVVVPGIARWLGLPPHGEDDGPEETWEAFCQRISRETPNTPAAGHHTTPQGGTA